MHDIEPNHFKLKSDRARRLGIDRNKIVLPCHLETMTGEEEKTHLCTLKGHGKVTNLPIKRSFIEVEPFDYLKVVLLQRRCYVGRVVPWVI